MKFHSTRIHGAWRIEPERHEDARGHFARVWCAREFAAHGLPAMVQANTSFSRQRGTLRGMHFQRAPSREGKLVRCVQGEIHDVIIDLRRESPSFMQHIAVSLSAAAGTMLYVPPGCAHGFQTLADDTVVNYLMTDYYAPELADGVRWNDPVFGIRWPIAEPAAMSGRDRDYPDLTLDDARLFERGA